LPSVTVTCLYDNAPYKEKISICTFFQEEVLADPEAVVSGNWTGTDGIMTGMDGIMTETFVITNKMAGTTETEVTKETNEVVMKTTAITMKTITLDPEMCQEFSRINRRIMASTRPSLN
jgi:MinD-like ATPase involved in chromosome partitioning or flagellar assembly